MDDAPSPTSLRDSHGRFGPGNPGRPPGARNKMSRAIALSLLRHFTENEAEILERLSRAHLSDYMRLLGRMLPDDPEAETTDIYGENTAPEDAGTAKARSVW